MIVLGSESLHHKYTRQRKGRRETEAQGHEVLRFNLCIWEPRWSEIKRNAKTLELLVQR